jgi:putative transposase
MHENGIVTLTEEEWTKAKQRNDVIGPLAKLSMVSRIELEEAAAQLGISKRQVYRLITQYRAGSGLVTDLAPRSSSGGKGETKLLPEIELIISEVINTLYLSRQRISKASITREIRKRCKSAGLQAPSYNTVNLRISKLDPMLETRKRRGGDAARRLRAVAGETPAPAGPLELVQMDHTNMDVIVVDETEREPIGRPSLTLAIDVFTRCIIGMLLTLEAPSATSVGLCLTHAVSDKRAWLERLGLDIEMWPMQGKPIIIYVDNGPEFHSEALKRGCEQYGIKLDYRPKGQPQFGGIIERVIGTAMKMAHEVPGTTFSNTQDRGTYKSEARAILTLGELEKWLVLAIGVYHKDVHESLFEPPTVAWSRSAQALVNSSVSDKQAFLINFLPIIRRRITRIGFVLDRIAYFGDCLKPWIASRDRLEKFIIRRDPRDISRIWVLDLESKLYFDIPYRSLSRPAVTLWEHRRAVENLRKQGREQVDEAAIFRMIDQMRELTEAAAKERKRARRDRSRRSHLGSKTQETCLAVPNDEFEESIKVSPFDVSEWTEVFDIPVPNDELGLSREIKPFEVEEW